MGKKKAPKPWKPQHVHAIYWAYPRHVGKRAALVAIENALTRLFDQTGWDRTFWLLYRTREYAASPAGKQGEFTPHPATWFNQGRYEDDPSEWQKAEVPKPDRPLPPSYHKRTEAEDVKDLQDYLKRTGLAPTPAQAAWIEKYKETP